jgi:hypothetical protein
MRFKIAFSFLGLISLILACIPAQAAPTTYDFEGYFSSRQPDRPAGFLPRAFAPGAKFIGSLVFDPELTRFDFETGEEWISPVVEIELRMASGEVIRRTRRPDTSSLDSILVRRARNGSDALWFWLDTAQENPAGSSTERVIFDWQGSGPIPGDLQTVDLTALQPAHWRIAVWSAPHSCYPECSPKLVPEAEGHITSLHMRGQTPGQYSETFSANLPSTWSTAGGSWSVQAGEYRNTANTAFTATSYTALTLQNTFEVSTSAYSGWSAAGNSLGLVFNYHSPSNYYEARFNALGTVTLNKVAGGVRTMLATASTSSLRQTWFNARVNRTGNRIRLSVGSTQLLDVQDSTPLSGGHAGLFASWNQARFDNFRVSQQPTWNVVHHSFSSAGGWTPTAGTWTVGSGYFRNSTNQQAAIALANQTVPNSYAIDTLAYLEWSAPGNRAGLVYDYQDNANYRAVLISPGNQNFRIGTLEVIEVRNGVRRVITKASEGPNIIGAEWGHISVTRLNDLTRIIAPGTQLVIRQPIVPGTKRVGLLASWNLVRFDDVVIGTPPPL